MIKRIWLDLCRQSFSTMIKDKLSREAAEAKKEVNGLPAMLTAPQTYFGSLIPMPIRLKAAQKTLIMSRECYV